MTKSTYQSDQAEIGPMATIDEVKMVLGNALQLRERAQRLEADTRLLGNLRKLDSMAGVTVLTSHDVWDF